MNRIETACCCLIASAIVLSGLLVVALSQRVAPNSAQAEMVIAREHFTLATAQTREGEESLFVLDNRTATLLVYTLDLGRDQLELVGGVPLERAFGGEAPASGRR